MQAMRKSGTASICGLGAGMALMIGISTAWTQTPPTNASDVKTLLECLKKIQDTGAEDCTGSVVAICLPDAEKASDAQVLQCTLRESAAWDVVLPSTYDQVEARTPEPAKPQLAEARAAWLASRQQTCDFMAAAAGDPTAKNVSAACYQTETANRVYLLLGLLSYLPQAQPKK
jgi:uncharacterized protein YecT (DUF1311 family)